MQNKKPTKRRNILFFNENSTQQPNIDTFYIDYRTEKTETPLLNSSYKNKKNHLKHLDISKKRELVSFPFIHVSESKEKYEPKYYSPEIKIDKQTTKKPAIFKAVLCLLLCVIGTTVLVNSANIDIFDAIYEENYNDFLLPVVFNDPEPFNSVNELNQDKILSSSIWYTVLNQNNRYYANYDDIGRVIIPTEDVSKSASILFGSNYSMPIKSPSCKTFFELDSKGENYLVCPISNDESYLPTVLSKTNSGDEIILHVGYSNPEDPFWTITDPKTPPDPEKIMCYTLAKDTATGRMYIKSIQEPTDNL